PSTRRARSFYEVIAASLPCEAVPTCEYRMVRRPRLSLVDGDACGRGGTTPIPGGSSPEVGRSEEVLELLLVCPALLLGGREQVGELRQGCALVEPCVAAGEAAVPRGRVGVDHPAPVTGLFGDDLGRPCAVVVTQGDCDRGEVGETPAPPTGRGLGAQQRPSHLPPVDRKSAV